jgi:hypothetical protein
MAKRVTLRSFIAALWAVAWSWLRWKRAEVRPFLRRNFQAWYICSLICGAFVFLNVHLHNWVAEFVCLLAQWLFLGLMLLA